MKDLLSPKQVARAIGVSESSLKRWCDRGLIASERTAGGHRRLHLNAVVAYVRKNGCELQSPELLGLPATIGRTEWTVTRAKDQLRDALVSGSDELCRQIILDIFIAGQPVSVICDQVIAVAFHEIGDLWTCGEVEIFEERRACEISVRLIHDLRRVVATPGPEAPTAYGATIDGDPYTLAVGMAELVLRDCGWRSTSLGHMLPFETLRLAIERDKPRLFWLSVSTIRNADVFAKEMKTLFDCAQQNNTAFAIGGRVLTPEMRSEIRFNCYCESFQSLQDFANSLNPGKSDG